MSDPLFHRSKSFLAVIDVQKLFVDKLAPEARAPLVDRIRWLIGTARRLGIPVLAMAEDIARNGPPLPEIVAALGADVPVHDKRVFGLAGQPDILAGARAFQRPQAVLVGLETDVCVAQSALGLLAAGFRVAVLVDATGSPGDCHGAGLDRMRDAGITVTTVKGIFYEWVRDLDTLATVRADLGPLPDGMTL
ncbi:isochorismatase family protein [Defluviimonas salinarum]|uniref:Isochorismatase family protein n=1 Tax=Defluviimonas salinarum TaxID=2992147 RepID=A0ABT3J688_9RHOB|nr:isochorismatase family protein [Defluviimonas salinarum]MCW3783173.1 isochorismatase family protein [Defluviimonas salinarum]